MIPVTRKARSTIQSSGSATTSVLYGVRKNQLKTKNAAVRQRDPERPATGRASAEHDDEEGQRDVRLVQTSSLEQQRRADDRERAEPDEPVTDSPRGRKHHAQSGNSNRYPTADSVRISRGRTDRFPASPELSHVHAQILLLVAGGVASHTARKSWECVSVCPACAMKTRRRLHSVGVRWMSSPADFTVRPTRSTVRWPIVSVGSCRPPEVFAGGAPELGTDPRAQLERAEGFVT